MSEPFNLLRVLSAAVGEELTWDRVLLLHNVGPLRRVETASQDVLGQRGCNALILDAGGGPKLYCKIRSHANTNFAREAALLGRLGGGTDGLVAATSISTIDDLLVASSEYREGRTLCRSLSQFEDGRWHSGPEEVLGRLALLLESRLEKATEARPRSDEGISVTERNLEVLTGAGGAHADVHLLWPIVRNSPPLPLVPQHGDLWCGNVLRGRTGWTVVDFEWCGRITTPLHDVFHLLRTCWDWRPGAKRAGHLAWLDRLREDTPDGRQTRRIIGNRASEHGLDGEQVSAAFVMYAADIAARLVRHGVSERRWGPFVREVETAARAAADGELTSILLPPGAEVASRAEPSPTPPGSPS